MSSSRTANGGHSSLWMCKLATDAMLVRWNNLMMESRSIADEV